ncbi:GAP family protein [Plantibacter sp. YIM 135347]|uniref:GAP family protein n=1 Tax=Plantibacter sp. YIM 135347 TaxID=3423919 RepID=UPI003D32E3C5
MGQVIGEILPLALGVAISPIPIIAAILMLLSPRAKSLSLGFLLGWLLGIVVASVVFTLIGSLITVADGDASQPIAGVVKIVLGALLLVLALGQWRKRPKEGETAALPKWMAAIDSMKPGAAFGLAFLLAAVNPKNLMMAAAAGVAIGTSSIAIGGEIVAVVVFVVIAVCSVAIPVIAYLVAADRMRAPLERLRVWLAANNATVMAILLLVIGVVTVGKGIGSF